MQASSDAAVTADDRDNVGPTVAVIGENVRRERRRQQLSVQALSQRAGVSFGLISELERGLGNPSVLSLHRLCHALDVPLHQLLAEPGGDSMVVRADERHILPTYDNADTDPTRRVHRELLTPRSRSNLQLIRSTLPPGFTNEGTPFRHVGTESVVVETGVLIVQHGDRRIELMPGDTVTYGCSTAHWWANGAECETVVLGAVSPFEE